MKTTPEEKKALRDLNDRVWEMVIYKVNPVFLYVFAQILIASHLGAHPAFRRFGFPIYLGQFLGAWTVFYSTLLKDMGFRNFAAPILFFGSIAALIAQYVWFRTPEDASETAVNAFILADLLPAVVLWIITMIQWRRLKRRLVKAPAEEKDR